LDIVFALQAVQSMLAAMLHGILFVPKDMIENVT